MTPEATAILQAVGVSSASQLAKELPDALFERINALIWQQGAQVRGPSLELVCQLVQGARTEVQRKIEQIFSLDDIPEAVVAPAKTPAARSMVEPRRQSSPAAVSPSRSGASGGSAVPRSLPSSSVREFSAIGATMAAAPPPIDTSRVRNFADYAEGRTVVKPLSRSKSMEQQLGGYEEEYADEEGDDESGMEARSLDRVAATAALSRWTVRGVVYPSPWKLLFGSFFSLLWRLALATAIIAAFYALALTPEFFTNNRPLVLGCIGVLLFFGIMNLRYSFGCHCRICSCPIFFSRNCLKNKKAHAISALGYVSSLALHMMLFRWFRCMYCGTAVRLWAEKK